MNHRATLRMCLGWPLEDRDSNSKMTPFLMNDLRARVDLCEDKVMQLDSKY